MKQLFIFILSSLFVSASLYTDAGTGSTESSTESSMERTEIRQLSQKSFGHSTGYDFEAIVTHPIHKTVATPHAKLIRWANLVNAVLLPPTPAADHNKACAPPYTYCKPIGMHLIFPQHYFW